MFMSRKYRVLNTFLKIKNLMFCQSFFMKNYVLIPKKNTNIDKMYFFLAFMAKQRILERNYEKMLHLLQ